MISIEDIENFKVEENTISFEYSGENSNFLYDICDLHGSVVLKGNLDNTKNRYEINLDQLQEGHYELVLIDGSKLNRIGFRIRE